MQGLAASSIVQSLQYYDIFSCASYLKNVLPFENEKKKNYYKRNTGNDVKNTLNLAHVQKSISRLLLKILV